MSKLTSRVAWPLLGLWMFCFGVEFGEELVCTLTN